MPEQRVMEVQEFRGPEQETPARRDDQKKPLFMLLSITAIVCCSLEVEILEKLDGMLLYMTLREILLDASVALLFLLGLAALWWICLLLVVKITDIVPWTKRHSAAIFWRLGLAIPLSYFALTLLNAIRLRIYPHSHPGIRGWLWIGPILVLLCTAGVYVTELSVLQRFCRTRLSPIGWVHIIFAVTAVIALCTQGVYVFSDFVHPGKAVAASGLPDIYLITVDALRADDMSLYGYGRPTTPNLERFAQRAFTFDYFFANSNFTTSSTTSIETGRLPWTHRVFQLGAFLRGQARQENLAALLREDGYYTASISSNCYASPIRHKTQDSYDAVELPLSGYAPSLWTRYSNLVGLNTLHTLSLPLLPALTGVRGYLAALIWSDRYGGPAELIFDRARILLERRDIVQPHFVWAHILPPHDPYLAPLPYRGSFLPTHRLAHLYDFIGLQNEKPPSGVSVAELQARYDESISYADHAVGSFLDWLDQTGRLDRAIVIVTADHGESFEHHWLMHTGPYLYNGLIRVPLLVHLPGQKQGVRISQAAEQVDLLPTILDLVGRQPPIWADGTSLRPSLEGKPIPQRSVFSMNLETNSTFEPITRGTLAIIDEDFKYIDRLGTQEVSLYRYRTDPLEEQNLVESEPAVAARMKALLADKLREVNAQPVPNP
jgi:arylsulfatase A-like enzyme